MMIESMIISKDLCSIDSIGYCSFDCKNCKYDDIEHFKQIYNETKNNDL